MLGESITKKRILITGAAGRVGRVLVSAWTGRYELFLTDICRPVYPLAGANFTLSDVTDLEQMRRLCSQSDVVIHLAIGGNLHDDWDQVAHVNLKGTWSVYQAASEVGVQRVVYASTVMVDFAPQNPYGASKRWGEILADRYVSNTPISILCLRLGEVASQDDLRFAVGKPMLGYVLTHHDLARLFTASVEAPKEIRYGVFHGISANQPPSFDIENTRRILGYDPQDDAFRIARRALFTSKGIYHLGVRVLRKIWRAVKKSWN